MDKYTVTITDSIIPRSETIYLRKDETITANHLKLEAFNGYQTTVNVKYKYLAIFGSEHIQETNISLFLQQLNARKPKSDVSIFITSQTESNDEDDSCYNVSMFIDKFVKLQISLKKEPIDDIESLFKLIDNKLKQAEINLDWERIDFDLDTTVEKLGYEKTKDLLPQLTTPFSSEDSFELFFLTTSPKTNDPIIAKERKSNKSNSIQKDNFEKVMDSLNKLEKSLLEKEDPKDGLFIDIPVEDEELFEFYNKVNTEEKLRELKHSYEKYQQWLTLYGNDENMIENKLIKLNETSKEIMDMSINDKGISSNLQYSLLDPLVPKNLVNLKIFLLDLNVCFKFTNEQNISLPSGLCLEFDFKLNYSNEELSGSNDLHKEQGFTESKTYCINLMHGFGANVTKTFTRFKHELGNNFHIQDIQSVRIVKTNQGKGGTATRRIVLFEGTRDFFKEEQEDKSVRIFNFNIVPDNQALDSIAINDIISTSLGNESESVVDIDDYELLTETITGNSNSQDDVTTV